MTRPAVATGASALPPAYETVVHMLVDAAARAPDAEALVCEDRRLCYRDYLACVAGFARELEGLGARGGRVALILGNAIESAIATFAVHAAGAQLVPLNPIYTARELGAILEDAAPSVVLYDAANKAVIASLVRALKIPAALALGPGARLLDGWRAAAVALPALPRPDALATLQYTGGTTGRAKGVELSHRAIAINVAQREGLLPTLPDRERLLCAMPLFHVYAVSMALHLSAYCRGALVILPRYRPDLVLKTLVDEAITIFPGSPTIFTGVMAVEGFAATDFSRLRLCYSGSAALPEETLRRWQAATGCPVHEGYGQTEAGPVLSFNPVGHPVKPGSVGIPVPATELQIVDPGDGTRVLAIGEQGEIRARGPQIMTGYRNLPKETAETLRDGWLYTGDIGELDRDGWLFIRERKKDMAIVGGYNVYPREVDEVLYLHPDVQEAAAIGVPDAYRGEVIKAFVVARPGTTLDGASLLAHCARNLAKYKVPTTIEVVAGIPKTTVGKIDKKELRAMAAKQSEGRS
ncbi:MAG: AMP-binding protein [Proteobacteria bacterium]|nr:AMP-binding protein [Pseudomonadota bacterium]